MKQKFSDFKWKNAVIKYVTVRRGGVCIPDKLILGILWPDGKRSEVIFKEIYWGKMDFLWFKQQENRIINAYMIDEQNNEKIVKWKRLYCSMFSDLNRNIKAFNSMFRDIDMKFFVLTLDEADCVMEIFAADFTVIDVS